jgi:hypothetical protein
MTRKVVAKEGFRFSNGVVLPEGAYVTVAAKPTHYDNGKSPSSKLIPHVQPNRPTANYENAATFDGFRFAREREAHMTSAHAEEHSDGQGQDFFKRQMISTGVDHLPFGTGKHACPVSTVLSLPFFI